MMDNEQIINSLNHLAEQKYLRVAGRSVCKHAADRIDALAAKLAKLAEVEAQVASDDGLIDRCEDVITRLQARAEAALPAMYQLGLADAATACDKERDEARANYCPTQAAGAAWSANAIRALPTPTAAELLARIQTGEKE